MDAAGSKGHQLENTAELEINCPHQNPRQASHPLAINLQSSWQRAWTQRPADSLAGEPRTLFLDLPALGARFRPEACGSQHHGGLDESSQPHTPTITGRSTHHSPLLVLQKPRSRLVL